MTPENFTTIAEEAFARVPRDVVGNLHNVALLVEEAPTFELLKEEGIPEGGTLLGLYRGVPKTARGSDYGVGPTLPDTITLFRTPILEEAAVFARGRGMRPEETDPRALEEEVKRVVEETLWHEIAHHFGMDEDAVSKREESGTNRYGAHSHPARPDK